jgi:uncharacterized protein (DUF362 family)
MPKKIDRREFVKGSLVTSAAIMGANAAGFVAPKGLYASSPDLVIARGSDPGKNVRAALDAIGGISRFVKPGMKVAVKPNMSFARGPKQAANTNPEVVAEVARMCHEAGASKISVLDYVLHSPDDCLKLSKIPETCQSVPNTVVRAVQNSRLFREIKVPQGQQFSSMRVISEVLDSDILISVPVGKSHGSAGVSLSMKGMMGWIYDRGSFHSRYNLHDAIVDMVSALKPHLVVVDGTRILTTGGPSGPGKVLELDLVIATTDMVAADAQMVSLGTWYGRKFQPKQVRHIRTAAQRGLGRMEIDKMNVREIKV